YKKLRNELRKKALETTKLQKKCQKLPKHDILHNKLNSTIQEVSNYYGMLEEREKQALRTAMIEERSRFCTLFTLLKPVMELEISLASEMSHIEDLVQYLAKHTVDPYCLPNASEQVIKDIKGIDYSTIVAFKTPPSSPGSLSSRKSSVCSINSISSSSSSSTSHSRSSNLKQVQMQQQPQSQIPIPIQHQFCHSNNTNRSLSMPSNVAVSRLSSVSSQDSGFTSQEQFFARPPSPLEEAEREVDGSSSPLLVVCSTLNAWAKRPDLPLNGKHSATVTGAPEPVKACRPAITAHTFDPPSPSLFEKPAWQIYEEPSYRSMTISEDGPYGTISRQHSIPSRRCRIRDLSLERHSPMREQHYQSTMSNNLVNGRVKPTQPPVAPADYYGTMTNRLSTDEPNQRLRSSTLPSEVIASDARNIVWRDRIRQSGSVSSSQYGSYYGRPSYESADETLDEMYEYLTKSSHTPIHQQKNETLRRGMSIAPNPSEKPAPPIRRTPSMNTNCQQQVNNGYIELQSRLKARLKRAEEIAGQADLVNSQQQQQQHKMMTVTKVVTNRTIDSRPNPPDEEFPPPPPDFLVNNDSKPPAPPPPPCASTITKPAPIDAHSCLLAEIQRGLTLRKTMTDRDRSAPRIK
ncbi:unnamed protein product, partial [Adineta ricciae]